MIYIFIYLNIYLILIFMKKEVVALHARISKEIKDRLEIAAIKNSINQEKMVEELLLYALKELDKQEERDKGKK